MTPSRTLWYLHADLVPHRRRLKLAILPDSTAPFGTAGSYIFLTRRALRRLIEGLEKYETELDRQYPRSGTL